MIKKLTKDIEKVVGGKIELIVTGNGISIYRSVMFFGTQLQLTFYKSGKLEIYRADTKVDTMKKIINLFTRRKNEKLYKYIHSFCFHIISNIKFNKHVRLFKNYRTYKRNIYTTKFR